MRRAAAFGIAVAAGLALAGCGGTSAASLPTVTATTSVTSLPTPSAPAVATTAAPSKVAPPLGLSVSGVTFVSADDGWLIGTVACSTGAGGRCPRAELTIDGGAHWRPIATPPGSPVDIRFATTTIGYAYGSPQSSVAITRDGGASWSQFIVPSPDGGSGITDLEIGGGNVWALGTDPYPPIFRSNVGGGTAAFGNIGTAGGRGASLSVQGGEAYVLGMQGAGPVAPDLEVATTAGVSNRTMPCKGTGANGDATALTPLTTASWLAVACVPETSSPATASSTLFLSKDDGHSWANLGTLSDCQVDSLTRTSAAIVAGCQNGGGVINRPLESAATRSLIGIGIDYVGFTTDTDGVAISAPASGPVGVGDDLYLTRDGGTHWTKAAV
jgi:hypothetical protein